MLALLTLSLTSLLAPQEPTDPEQTPAGRKVYLGREVAHTMHWSGAGWLMRQTREKEENGALLHKWLALQPGTSVCDFGCGNGYHTVPMAKAVGKDGKVWAVDLQPQMLTLLKKRCGERDINNVQYVQATIDDPKLPQASCDHVLLVDVYHELSHPVRVMAHLRRALKPGGRITLVEFRAEDPDVPIKPEHMMSKAQVVQEMASHGFELTAEFDALPWQHTMSFSPAKIVGPRFAPRQVMQSFLAATSQNNLRVVEPFLAADTTTDDLPKLTTAMQVELRSAGTDSLLAELRGSSSKNTYTLELRKQPDGRWLIATSPQPPARPFVAMNTALGGGPIEARVQLADKIGFDGVAWGAKGLATVRTACEERGDDLWSAYFVLDVAGATEQQLAPLRQAMTAMAGGPGMIWLAVRNSQHKPRTPAGDATAAKILRPLLQHANKTGVEIALYPHHGFWIETTTDALRVCQQLHHSRLGVCFNVCHHLRAGASNTRQLLQQVGKHLFAVTVNGADIDGKNWSKLIQPLGQGSWDLGTFVDLLDELQFTGPIGLQGYGIRRPAAEHLAESMAAWRTAMANR